MDKHVFPIHAAAIGFDNDRFVFSISDKLILFDMENLSVLGEIYLVKTNDPYKKLITYFSKDPEEANDLGGSTSSLQLKNIAGGFLVSNKNTIISYGFDSSIYFHKTFESRLVHDLALISENHIVVQFEEETALHVYSITTGEQVLTQNFDECIEEIYCNTYTTLINQFKYFKEGKIVVGVLLRSMCFKLFEVCKAGENLNLKNIFEIPSSGFKIESFRFCKTKDDYRIDSADYFSLAFSDGSLAMVDITEKKPREITYFKPNIKEKLKFKIVDFLSSFSFNLLLLLGSNKYVYLLRISTQNESVLIEIPGNFDNAYMLAENKIACCKKGIIFIYLIVNSNTGYICVNKNQINAHYDDITFGFVKDMMFLTASLDSTIKVFIISRNKEIIIDDFDTTATELQKLYALSTKYCMSIGESKYFFLLNSNYGCKKYAVMFLVRYKYC